MHFRDMNGETPVYKRAFSDGVKRCEDMSRRVTFLATQIAAAGLSIEPAPEGAGALLPSLDAAEGLLRQAQLDRQEARGHENQVAKAHNALKEHLHVLSLGGAVFDGGSTAPAELPAPSLSRGGSEGLGAPLLASAYPTGSPLGDEGLLHVQCGTIPRYLAPALVRAVHRVTRGNCMVHEGPIEEALLGFAQDAREASLIAKNYIVLVYSGGVLHTKVPPARPAPTSLAITPCTPPLP